MDDLVHVCYVCKRVYGMIQGRKGAWSVCLKAVVIVVVLMGAIYKIGNGERRSGKKR